MVLGEILFFTLGNDFAFGLWYGVIIALGMNYLLVTRTREILDDRAEDDKISWRVSFFALARIIIYGLALAVATLTNWLNFFAAAGGLILPLVALRFVMAFKNVRSGGG